MDPRPYHFDYRRPRPTNPTFLSPQLYDRLQPGPNPELKRAASTELRSGKVPESKGRYQGSLFPDKGREERTVSGSMASYGRSLLGQSRFQQQEVFRHQEREFNIISYWPRAVHPSLRQFPRLTLEDKLLERGISQPESS